MYIFFNFQNILYIEIKKKHYSKEVFMYVQKVLLKFRFIGIPLLFSKWKRKKTLQLSRHTTKHSYKYPAYMHLFQRMSMYAHMSVCKTNKSLDSSNIKV